MKIVLAPGAKVEITNDTDGERIITVRDVRIRKMSVAEVTAHADGDDADRIRLSMH